MSHLEFPLITPSGFIIGTILKIIESRRFTAIGLLDRMNSMKPCKIQDDVVYEGWTLAVIMTTLLVDIIYLAYSFFC